MSEHPARALLYDTRIDGLTFTATRRGGWYVERVQPAKKASRVDHSNGPINYGRELADLRMSGGKFGLER